MLARAGAVVAQAERIAEQGAGGCRPVPHPGCARGRSAQPTGARRPRTAHRLARIGGGAPRPACGRARGASCV
jgi:hypothetical protein